MSIRPYEIEPRLTAPRFALATSVSALRGAWSYLRARTTNQPGIDDVTRRQFDREARYRLPDLSDELALGEYRMSPARLVVMHEGSPRQQTVGISTIEDRIVLQAVKKQFDIGLDADLAPDLYAHRQGRGLVLARMATAELAARYRFGLRFDLRKFFESVPHAALSKTLERFVADTQLASLIRMHLRAGTMCGSNAPTECTKGLIRGALLSPFLGNLLLTPISLWLREAFGPHVIYADDFAVFSNDREKLSKYLERLRVRLPAKYVVQINEEKLGEGVVDLHRYRMTFLGYEYGRRVMRPSWRTRTATVVAIRSTTERKRRRELLRNYVENCALCDGMHWDVLRVRLGPADRKVLASLRAAKRRRSLAVEHRTRARERRQLLEKILGTAT